MVLVPVQYRRLLDHPEFDRFDLSSFRNKFCTLRAHEHPDKLDTVGVPNPGIEMFVIDEAGHVLSQGQVGELVGRSRSMMSGYHGREKETAEASWFDAEGRRFQRSGDNGWFDADGFLHLLDRKKDVIISGGFNVYAIDLENVLMQHPDVVEAAVIAAPSPEWGETPVAYAVLRANTSSESIRLWANERLGKFQRITQVNRDGGVAAQSYRKGAQARASRTLCEIQRDAKATFVISPDPLGQILLSQIRMRDSPERS